MNAEMSSKKSTITAVLDMLKSGIFLENNFKYQNAHNNDFGGAISANYRGFFTISCLLFDNFRGGMAP